MDVKAAFGASPLFQALEAISTENRELPDSAAKRHHFVPRFMLERFSTTREGRDRLVQLDVRSGRPVWADPATAASRHRFYRVTDDDGVEHQKVEALLALVETHAAPVITRICNGESALSHPDRATLSLFLSLLEGRTLGGLERVESFATTVMLSLYADKFGDDEAFAATYREVVGPADDASIKRAQRHLLDALADGGLRVDDPKAMSLRVLFDLAEEQAQIIFQLRWTLVETAPGSHFVTSDRGIAMHDRTPLYPFSGHGWLSSPGAETSVPIGPSHCLVMSPDEHGPTSRFAIARATAEQVDELNLRTYGHAQRYVFSAAQADLTRLRALAKANPQRVVRPRPTRQVMLIDAEPGDDRLAQEHISKGWPSRLLHQGDPHDYVVLEMDGRVVEQSVNYTRLSKERAIKRLGTTDISGGRAVLHPADIEPI